MTIGQMQYGTQNDAGDSMTVLTSRANGTILIYNQGDWALMGSSGGVGVLGYGDYLGVHGGHRQAGGTGVRGSAGRLTCV